jgi:hypothetical protein
MFLKCEAVFTTKSSIPDLVHPSPPCSSFNPGREEPGPVSDASEPAGAYVKVVASQYSQFDGACDERQADENVGPQKSSSAENKMSPQKSSSSGRPSLHRTISNTSKKAIEKDKELTTHVTEPLQNKLRGGSPFRPSAQGFPTKQPKQTANANTIERIAAGESLNSRSVHAASSALKLTEENIKGLTPGTRPVSQASEHSFGSLVVNLPGDRPSKPRKPQTPYSFAQYAGGGSLEAMHCYQNEDNGALQQVDAAGFPHKIPAPSDATDLQSHGAQPSWDRKISALQESVGVALSDLTNVSNTKRKEVDDEGKAQLGRTQVERGGNKDVKDAGKDDVQS